MMKSDNMFGIKNKKQKDKLKMKMKLKYKIKSKAIKKAKRNPAVLKSAIKKAKTPVISIQTQTQNQPQRYRDPEFIKYRTKTLAKATSETANTNSIAKFKQQIYNIKYLSVIDSSYGLENNFALLDRIIDFIEKTDYLLDQKYTEDVWHIKAELYHLKSMIANQHIYNSQEIKQEINEIKEYTSEHL